MKFSKHLLVGPLLLILFGCGQPKTEAEDWSLYGRTSDDQRYSPLKQIDEGSVSKLGLSWSKELGTTRGLEATPLVEKGVIYISSAWSVVFAFDAKTGEQRWTYDPKVDRSRAFFFCCDVVNRGVALANGKVFVGTMDGKLIALDQKTGTPVWTAETTDPTKPYSITSAPRIAKNLVVIGNGGAEFGVRGHISAYDTETGKMAWRFYTVPGDPAKGFESKAMEAAAKTWSGEYWKTGGGGTPWEGMSYDPALDLLYFGTGNPTAWYRALRGKGESLYTASIVAVRASTGELAWYYQTTPGDNWDYDATQPIMQAELTIDGRPRNVVMQANKNGFFYVLDRATGEFISGTQFVPGVTWATSIDSKGRPVEAPGVGQSQAMIISPSPDGAHNWNPMAFHPSTGLVYFSAKVGTQFLHAPNAKWKYDGDDANLGLENYDGPLNDKLRSMPPSTGELVAWDPVAKTATWRATYPVNEGGGALATAGNLVFQGRSDGILAAYRANDGKVLWTFDAATGIMAPPVTYTVDGVQYLTVLAGWGGAPGLFNATPGPLKPGYGRILTFALNATATLKAPKYGHDGPPTPIPSKASKQTIHQGQLLFNQNCAPCHGINAVAGPTPDLRYSKVLDDIDAIVLKGTRASAGMPSFARVLTPAEVRVIREFILSRTH